MFEPCANLGRGPIFQSASLALSLSFQLRQQLQSQNLYKRHYAVYWALPLEWHCWSSVAASLHGQLRLVFFCTCDFYNSVFIKRIKPEFWFQSTVGQTQHCVVVPASKSQESRAFLWSRSSLWSRDCITDLYHRTSSVIQSRLSPA